jgi:putative flavoprotein involved in K+ transport
MNSNILDIIVIGAGHAGLAISYHLKQHRFNHIVFERHNIGDTWLRQRWDSFKLNTPNNVNLLPGMENTFSAAEAYSSAKEFVSCLQTYARKFKLPIRVNSEVISVEKAPDREDFIVCVSENGSAGYYLCKQVVIASGTQNRKIIPAFANEIPQGIIQLHASQYRNAGSLPEGAVLVVGSAQSGVQIAEDLVDSGRKVFLSTSRVGRFPRRYRGRDIVDWLILTGFFDQMTTSVTDPEILKAKLPQISGTGMHGHTLSLQSLARKGTIILGKAESAADSSVILQPDAPENIRFADEISYKIKAVIDDYIAHEGLEAPLPEEDNDDKPDNEAASASSVTNLKLKKNNITSVIWATGFNGSYSFLKIPSVKEYGLVSLNNNPSYTKGLYFIGTPWLRKRKSGIILGIREDAAYIAGTILSHTRVEV